MKHMHHQLEFEISDEWIHEAGVFDFKPNQDYFVPDTHEVDDRDVFPVPIDSVAPLLERAKNKGIFCDSHDTGETAKQRVMRILVWLRENEPIEPVRVVRTENAAYEYRLVEGCHRFYCALALGFTKVPAILGIDFSDQNA